MHLITQLWQRLVEIQKQPTCSQATITIKGNLVFVELCRLKYCHHRFSPARGLFRGSLMTILRMFGLRNKMGWKHKPMWKEAKCATKKVVSLVLEIWGHFPTSKLMLKWGIWLLCTHNLSWYLALEELKKYSLSHWVKKIKSPSQKVTYSMLPFI